MNGKSFAGVVSKNFEIIPKTTPINNIDAVFIICCLRGIGFFVLRTVFKSSSFFISIILKLQMIISCLKEIVTYFFRSNGYVDFYFGKCKKNGEDKIINTSVTFLFF